MRRPTSPTPPRPAPPGQGASCITPGPDPTLTPTPHSRHATPQPTSPRMSLYLGSGAAAGQLILGRQASSCRALYTRNAHRHEL